jgi:ubiquinone/menaquinone biosynthesis C-methylase UbiE
MYTKTKKKNSVIKSSNKMGKRTLIKSPDTINLKIFKNLSELTKTNTKKLKVFNNISDLTRGAFADVNFQKSYSCNYKEYINLLNDTYNYRKYYKDYKSDQQIKTIINLAVLYDPIFLSRIIELILKRFNPKLLPDIIKILLMKENDSIIYKKLKKLYNSKENKVNLLSSASCSKNKILSQYLIGVLKRVKEHKNTIDKKIITNYLDIGTGNGSFAVTFGNELKLDKDHIFGCDFNNFSEQGDWGRNKLRNKFVFKELEKNKPYPFEDNSIDIITMKMVLHHIDNLDFTINEINRILTKKGILIIIDHTAFTYVDYMLADIEHGLYINVYNTESDLENYTYTSKKNKSSKKNIDVVKYYDFPELDFIMSKYNLHFKATDIFTEHIYKTSTATRAIYTFYQKE